MKTYAFQVADIINIKNFKEDYAGTPVFSDSNELFYSNEEGQFLYIFKYGVVCFYNYDQTEMSRIMGLLKQYCRNISEVKITEEYEIEVNPEKDDFSYNSIIIREAEVEVIKLIMLNVSQSVVLDYYSRQTELLLEDTQQYTFHLEEKGEINISGKKLKSFIGKSLNLKNKISENLYIFSSPPITWDNEYLNKTDQNLKKAFDLKLRTRNLQEDIQIIKENLDLFKEFLFHQKSDFLEIIIIILILVEVVNLIIEKLF